ncbi:AI-2E family transporter [Salinimicrobium tongyeongense]|uniref:AI-2E family transporter n=1 Tax=Salinimicrobium tongyeongense TaxID=2809707 RepID=A0ABY6NNU9_9FLAO|nr:AI-2E family transporter [Salinimicrobium tongyeongense]UZH54575.1 AI-2E family transporter [Salinimicrobium tongyeongense]
MSRGLRIGIKVFMLVMGLYFFFEGLAAAKGFLAPLALAIVLALVVLPAARKLEKLIGHRGFSAILGTLLIFIFSLGFLTLCSMQIQSFFNQWPVIKQAMAPEVESFKSFLFEHTPLSKESLQNYYSSGSIPFFEEQVIEAARALSFLRSSLNFMGTYLITFIYIFFLLYYRRHFKEFILSYFSDKKRAKAGQVLESSAKRVQDYLLGRLILMAILAVLYSLGLGLSGVHNYLLVGVIASVLTLIPWIGNIIGFAMAMVFGYLTSGNLDVLWGIVITFTVSQFLESYVLQPYVVGDKVGLHPFFVILFVIMGGAIWGLVGMVLAIPVMAMATVIFNHVDVLKPLGFLFSKQKD